MTPTFRRAPRRRRSGRKFQIHPPRCTPFSSPTRRRRSSANNATPKSSEEVEHLRAQIVAIVTKKDKSKLGHVDKIVGAYATGTVLFDKLRIKMEQQFGETIVAFEPQGEQPVAPAADGNGADEAPSVPAAVASTTELSEDDIEINREGAPPLGALELYVNGTLLFSTLKSGSWPSKTKIKKRFMSFIQGKKSQFYDVI